MTPLPAVKFLLAISCSWNAETGRFDTGCGPHDEMHFGATPALAKAACEQRAVELRATTPAGVKVVTHSCGDARAPLLAKGQR